MDYPFLQWAIWLAGAAVLILLLKEIVRSRLFRTYPFLSAYVCWQVLRVAPSMIAFRYFPPATYSVLFWFFEIVSWGLMFLFILEMYDHALHPYSGLRKLSRVSILWVGLGLLTAVCGTVLFTEVVDPEPTQWINNWFYLMRGSVRIVHAGLLLILVLFLSWFRVKTSLLLRYLILGSLVTGTLHVAVSSLRYELGTAVYSLVSLGRTSFDVGMLMVWYWAIRQSRARQEQELTPVFTLSGGNEALVLARLEGINASLTRAFRQ